MKIGINAAFLRKPETGIGQVTENFLKTLSRFSVSEFLPQDTEVSFVLYTQTPISLDLPQNFSVCTFLPRLWRRDDIPRQWLWERELARRAERDGCDVFLSLSQSATIFPKSKIQSPKSSFRHIMVVHDLIPQLFPAYLGKWSQRFHWRAIERGIRSATRILAVSRSTQKDIVEELGLSPEKIAVVYPGLAATFEHLASDEEVQRVLEVYGVERGYIYHGGGLEIRKNTQVVLEAYRLLRDKRSDIPPLVISGKIHAKENPLATDVAGLIKHLGLEGSVHLLGRVPLSDLPALYRGASMFVYPSWYEGFGLPPLEALSQETPVITSRVSSLPEVCGETVLYIDPEQPETIVTAMERCLSDKTLRETLGKQGRVQAERFSYAQFTEEIIRQCLAL